ncbi:MAG: phosphoribosyltransferase family protein [Candidatus Aenigmarchaeota archaeon]|nr:phosphoribosyltransferase family protein [Candidatus Aenigmarchaeota archaeon]
MRPKIDWKRIIKEVTERCEMTTFSTPQGEPYPYVILPFESIVPFEFIDATIEGMSWMLEKELSEANKILAIEAKGFIPASWLAQRYGKDLVVIRKRDYKIPHQIEIEQTKAYGRDKLYGAWQLREDDKLLIVEDIISSGGTLIGVTKDLEKRRYSIVGIGSVYERGNGIDEIKEKTGHNAKGLARLEVMASKPHVVKFYGESTSKV